MATISDMHETILSAIRDQLPVLQTVRDYHVGASLETPAALLELETMEEGEDDGTEMVPLRCTWTIHCVLGRRTDSIEREVRDFAAQVLALVRRNRWGLPTSLPEAITSGPGEFQTGQDGFESWYVTWEQELRVGTDIWQGDGTQPDTVYAVHGGDTEEVTE